MASRKLSQPTRRIDSASRSRRQVGTHDTPVICLPSVANIIVHRPQRPKIVAKG